MTHIDYFYVSKNHIEDSIHSLEDAIANIVDGLHSMYHFKINRSGKFETGQVGATIEIYATVQEHVIYSAVHYLIGKSSETRRMTHD